MSRSYVEITKEHVGKSTLRAFGRTWLVLDFLGHIKPQDVGKRVYLFGDYLQAENNEQRDKRLGGICK